MRLSLWKVLVASAGGALLLLLGLSVALGDQSRPKTGPRPAPPETAPVQGESRDGLYVDPSSDAGRQQRQWVQDGRNRDAESIRAISGRAGAQWYGEPDTDPVPVRDRVERLTTQATEVGATPVIVIYSIPFRDCGSFSSGGSTSEVDYARYVEGVADGIGDRKALVVLEPDAVAHIADRCVTGRRARDRVRVLRSAMETLKAGSQTQVYLDAGNAGYISASEIAPLLRRAGIARADGFSVNVANFHTTRASLAHGRAISRHVGGKPFVVDTSRNGRGPWRSNDRQTWCNPPGRALGRPPTMDTGQPDVDAYLWIKRPGESDGTCRSGPTAGQWWPQYALRLARASRSR